MTLSEQIRVLCVRCKVSEVELARRLDRIVLSLFDFDIVGVLRDGVIYIVKTVPVYDGKLPRIEEAKKWHNELV